MTMIGQSNYQDWSKGICGGSMKIARKKQEKFNLGKLVYNSRSCSNNFFS